MICSDCGNEGNKCTCDISHYIQTGEKRRRNYSEGSVHKKPWLPQPEKRYVMNGEYVNVIEELEAECKRYREALEQLQKEHKILSRQKLFLQSALTVWRLREWPGTDQNKVIERDLALVRQQALEAERKPTPHQR